MITTIVTDIDGILLGHERGNIPASSTIEAIKRLQARHIHISLCTMKALFSIQSSLIMPLHLDDLHITNGGSALISGKTMEDKALSYIPPLIAERLVGALNAQDIYCEFYTPSAYFVTEKSRQQEEIFNGRVKNLGVPPRKHDIMSWEHIVKIYATPDTEEKKTQIRVLGETLSNDIALHWGKNPSLYPELAAIFTPTHASKETALQELVHVTNTRFDQILGIGDSTSDWEFMKHCGYVATVANATDELKALVLQKPQGYVSNESINGDGFSDIVEHFSNLFANAS